MPAHPATVLGVRPTVSVGLIPALFVCLAAPAFFVVRLPWLGWALLAAGMLVAWLVRGRTDAEAEASRASAPAPPEGAATRTPSLVRDLSLIALGLLIVSAIDLAAELDNLAFLRFTLALGGAVAVPYVVSRFVYRDYAIRFPWRGGGRWTTFQWSWLAAVLDPRLADPAVLLHHLGRLPELAGGRTRPSSSRGCSSAWARSASGTSCSSSAPSSRCCAATSRTGRRTCCRRSCSCRSCGSSATRRGGRC